MKINRSICRIGLGLTILGLSAPAAQAQVVRSYLGVGHYPPRQNLTYQKPNIRYYHRQPHLIHRSRSIRRSVLVNPTVINSTISDSILINPTIIDRRHDSYRRSYYRPRRRGTTGHILIQIK